MGNEEVSAVSQAWFTTKEDKDSLTNKGRIFQMYFSRTVKKVSYSKCLRTFCRLHKVISGLAFLEKMFEKTDSKNAERCNALSFRHSSYALYARRKLELQVRLERKRGHACSGDSDSSGRGRELLCVGTDGADSSDCSVCTSAW